MTTGKVIILALGAVVVITLSGLAIRQGDIIYAQSDCPATVPLHRQSLNLPVCEFNIPNCPNLAENGLLAIV